MRKIYAIGETLYDIIFKDGQPQAAKPGGAMLNSTVSLGRAGLPVSFISEYGNDPLGRLIDTFLNNNGVMTDYVNHFTARNTALAIAILNEKNDATYTFYKDYPEKRLDIVFPELKKDDLLLCGSIYSITGEIREKFLELTVAAARSGAIVVYDPNFRSAHAAHLGKHRPLIIENMQNATMVRGSDEDFQNIFGTTNADEAWEVVSRFTGCLVYTANSEGVYVRTRGFSGQFPVARINPVSTIGAGDNFNAGMMAAIYINNIPGDELPYMGETKWEKVINMGISFATDVCMSYDNYISEAFAAGLKIQK